MSKKVYKQTFFCSVRTNNSNWETVTKNSVGYTFKRWDEIKDAKF